MQSKAQRAKFLIHTRRPQTESVHTMHSQVGRRGVYLMEYYDYAEANNNLREQTRCKQTCMKSHPRAHPRDSETYVQRWREKNEKHRREEITPTSKREKDDV